MMMTANVVVLATGPLNRPKLPIAGITSFEGHMFHTVAGTTTTPEATPMRAHRPHG